MRKENIVLVTLGIILFFFGLGCSFYRETRRIPRASDEILFPYQMLGIVVVLAGIVLIAMGLVFEQKSFKKKGEGYVGE